MFGFQKEVVINSADAIKTIGSDAVCIDGVLYKKAYMGKVFKTEHNPGKAAAVKINVADYANKHVSILIELGLDKDYRGDFASALYYFRKPILVDLKNASADDVAKAIEKTLPTDYKMVTTSVEGDNVTVTAADKGYIKVLKVVINEYDAEGEISNTVAWYPTDGFDKDGNIITVTKNIPEFGTYNYLIQNLRLPTYENLRFTSPAAVEMPAPNTNYTQYSFIYTVPRHIGGTSVVGEVNHSTTTHTFYVAEDVVEDMETALNKFESVTPGDATIDDLTAPEVTVVTSEGAKEVVENYPMHTEDAAATTSNNQ